MCTNVNMLCPENPPTCESWKVPSTGPRRSRIIGFVFNEDVSTSKLSGLKNKSYRDRKLWQCECRMLHEIDGNTMKHSIPIFLRKNCDGKETMVYVMSIGGCCQRTTIEWLLLRWYRPSAEIVLWGTNTKQAGPSYRKRVKDWCPHWETHPVNRRVVMDSGARIIAGGKQFRKLVPHWTL